MVGNWSADLAYEFLLNGSVLSAASEIYMDAWNGVFWSVLFLVVLLMIYVKTDSAAFIFVYVLFGNFVLGNVLLPYSGLRMVFYAVLVFSFGLVAYKFFGSSKTE
jgi:hypothetical protein